jgi:competence ComEA-like helix-hairpin-helix protein
MAKRFSLAAGLALGCATVATAQTEASDKATFQKVCGTCHAPGMVSDLKTEAEWSETVDQMVSIGAKGTTEEFNRVLRYLSNNFTRVNVNTASAAQIAPVLGVSEAVAQAVVDYRMHNGSFASLDDLKKVPGLAANELDSRGARIAFR